MTDWVEWLEFKQRLNEAMRMPWPYVEPGDVQSDMVRVWENGVQRWKQVCPHCGKSL